ncbi:MAG: ADP-ribose pyrophosphatase YjhB (NUDIX family) [Candidatus Azotimanducaceae bacterium]|jgi:8-oxo-dGTP diphosphatase
MKQTTRIACYGILREKDQILLCHLTNSERWTLPGGGIEFGESPEQAMVREVREETGLDVVCSDFLGINSFVREGSDDQFHSIQIVYLADVVGGELTYEIGGSTDYCAWQPTVNVPNLDVVDLVSFALKRL